MGKLNPGDITAEGFGAGSGAFAPPGATIGRYIRTIRASRSRVTITGIDAWFFCSNIAISTTRIFSMMVTVFRQSASNPFPDQNLALITLAQTMPTGVECLWNINISGTFTTSAASGQQFPSPLSQNSFQFYPGTIAADAGQILLVVCTQALGTDGAAHPQSTLELAVTGFDYGEHAVDSILPGERSFPRFNIRT